MKELEQILKKTASLEPSQNAILATVVDVQGSSYRLPGAKMLIVENGDTFGTVSGGCLEADVLERAKKVWQTNDPQIFVYDTTKDENSVFSLNMGCRGVIRILLEPIRANKYIEFLHDSFTNRRRAVSATLISAADDLKIGARFTLAEDGFIFNQFGENSAVENDARTVLETEKSVLKTYEFGDIFYEYLAPTLALTVFGAGADVVPLAEIAKNLGWHLTVVDHRPAFVTRERFANADRLILNNSDKLPENIVFDNRTAAVIMTHNYDRDRDILAGVINSEVFYVGALGPKRRTENLLNELTASGVNFDEQQLRKLHAPIGLDLGADTPEAIALSIISEIQAVLTQRRGGFLRDRKGSIYGRN